MVNLLLEASSFGHVDAVMRNIDVGATDINEADKVLCHMTVELEKLGVCVRLGNGGYSRVHHDGA